MRTDKLEQEYFGHEHVTVIEPARGWRSLDLRELWAYRELLWVLTMRDIKVRYKQTVLGVAWAVLQPVMTMVVFSVIFGRLAGMPSDDHSYPVFVYAGLLPWMYFSNAVSAASNSLVGAQHLISKVYFPRLIVPLSSVGAGLVDLAVSSGVLLVLMVLFGAPIGPTVLLAPFLIAGVVLCALGVGIALAALTVAYRDFRFVVPFMLQIWMYCTPVVYATSLIPEKWRWVLEINPLTGLVGGVRSAFLGDPLDFMSIGLAFAMGLVLFLISVFYFERVERRFADII